MVEEGGVLVDVPCVSGIEEGEAVSQVEVVVEEKKETVSSNELQVDETTTIPATSELYASWAQEVETYRDEDRLKEKRSAFSFDRNACGQDEKPSISTSRLDRSRSPDRNRPVARAKKIIDNSQIIKENKEWFSCRCSDRFKLYNDFVTHAHFAHSIRVMPLWDCPLRRCSVVCKGPEGLGLPLGL